MALRSPFVAVLGIALGSLVGCGNEEGVVLEASLDSPVLTVTATPLTTDLTGSFDIELSLGERASDPTTVKLGVFSLLGGDEVVFSPLELDTSPGFPLTVDVGGTKHVDVTIANPDGPVELADALCGSPLQIRGTLTDSLGDDRPQTVTSLPFPPDCR
jgi:hypothetical protein